MHFDRVEVELADMCLNSEWSVFRPNRISNLLVRKDGEERDRKFGMLNLVDIPKTYL
jgi:hypothetical protein